MSNKICSVEGCTKKHFAKGKCRMHYQREYRRRPQKRKKAQYGIYKQHPNEAQSYLNMKQRCYSVSSPSYPRYGGNGIKVCDRWLGPYGFANFIKDMGERPQGKTLDRIDNSKGYSPDNCRWSSVKEQNRNRKTNIFYTYMGQTLVLTDWAEQNGLRPEVVYYRWHKGERGEKLFRPSQK